MGVAAHEFQPGELEDLAASRGAVADWLIALARELLAMGEARAGADHPGWDVNLTVTWAEKKPDAGG